MVANAAEYIVNLKARLAYVMQNTPASDGSSLDIAPVDTAAGKVRHTPTCMHTYIQLV
jgi:hypothetical protein